MSPPKNWSDCQKASLAIRLLGGSLVVGGAAYYLKSLCNKIRLGSVIWSKGWISELSSMWPGQAFSLQIRKKLFDAHSPYQHVQIFDCGDTWGRVLVLDGVIQATEKDECSYQEMMAHVPMTSCPFPKKVLVIGGGDGGVLRELAKYDSVSEIHICEIDSMVISASKAFLPSMACGFDDPRVEVHVQDGFSFLQAHKDSFDVIIVDSSDPIGPAEGLFKEPFYKAAELALKPGGVFCCQSESIWLHMDVIKQIQHFTTKYFSTSEYATISVPSYPCGNIGMFCCTKDKNIRCSTGPIDIPEKVESSCKYYNKNMHITAFMLPNFAEKELQKSTII